jgi:hypothetical protein
MKQDPKYLEIEQQIVARNKQFKQDGYSALEEEFVAQLHENPMRYDLALHLAQMYTFGVDVELDLFQAGKYLARAMDWPEPAYKLQVVVGFSMMSRAEAMLDQYGAADGSGIIERILDLSNLKPTDSEEWLLRIKAESAYALHLMNNSPGKSTKFIRRLWAKVIKSGELCKKAGCLSSIIKTLVDSAITARDSNFAPVNRFMAQNLTGPRKKLFEGLELDDSSLFGQNFRVATPRTCDMCGRQETGSVLLKRCGRCLVTMYCSRECQKKSWKSHKKVCAKRVKP